jgi:MFS family permease
VTSGKPEAEAAGVLQTLRELPVAARVVLLGVFINQFGAFLQLFIVLYLVERGFRAEQAGVALGAYAVGAILGTLFGGGLSDRLGPRWTIVVSVGLAALFTLSITALSWYPAILVAVGLAGAMTQSARPAVSALLFNLVPEARQVMVFAMYRTALNAGAVAGPLVAVWLSTISWNLVFWFDAASALIYCAIAVFLLPRDQPDPVSDDENGEPASAASYRTLFGDQKYLAYLLLMLANGLVHVQFFAVLPLMLKADGYPTWAYGAASSITAFIVISFELLVTRTTQTWPTWVAVMAGWVLLVIGRGAFGLPGGLAIIFAATLIATIGQVIGGPAAFAYPAKVAPVSARGRYIASAHASFNLGYVIGPIVGVLLWESVGKTFWAICFAFGVLIVFPGIWAMRPSGSPAVTESISK